MVGTHLGHAVKRAEIWVVFLIGVAVAAGGCSAPQPPPSQQARAFQKQVLQQINNLTEKLTGSLSAGQDWESLKPILQAGYEKMKGQGEPVPQEIVVLDREGITRVRVPSESIRHYDFSQYRPARTAFKNKRRVQAVLYLKGAKIFITIISLTLKPRRVLKCLM
ncbi:MAG: hypothetical protein ACOC6L_03945, partial [Thermodesulfobacteriota bacterium]